MLNSEQEDEECDARDDELRTGRWSNKKPATFVAGSMLTARIRQPADRNCIINSDKDQT